MIDSVPNQLWFLVNISIEKLLKIPSNTLLIDGSDGRKQNSGSFCHVTKWVSGGQRNLGAMGIVWNYKPTSASNINHSDGAKYVQSYNHSFLHNKFCF